MTKDISAKTWLLSPNYDGTLDSRYPNGDKPGGTVVAPTLGTPSMGSNTAAVPFTGGANYTTLIPQYRLDGASSWNSLASDMTSPLNYSGLVSGEDYEFRALADGDVNLASNIVTGTTATSTTDRSQLAFWLNADARTTGQLASTGGVGYYGFDDNGLIINSATPYTGKSKSVLINFPSGSGTTYEFAQGFFIEDMMGQLGFRVDRGDTLWWSFRVRPGTNTNWLLKTGDVTKKWLHNRNDPPGEVGGQGVFSTIGNNGNLHFDNDEITGQIGEQPIIYAGNAHPPIGVWTTLELMMVVDTIPVSLGGSGEMRFYQNGILLGHYTSGATMSPTTLWPLNEIRWISNWNEGGPINTFDVEIDDFCVAAKVAGVRDDTPHMATDADGRKYIGM